MQANSIPFLQLLNGEKQYVVPRWQRRYCWGRSDIERLVQDLLTIAAANRPQAAHFGGALLTLQEPVAAGGMLTHRVVDGQQRLTTVSILLACIVERMGAAPVAGWTRRKVRNLLLNDSSNPPDKRRKLRLQREDDDEYCRILDSHPKGPGAVTQAWRIALREVRQCDMAQLLMGLDRFKIVSIGLDHTDDPQQVFESINATGRPLAESEKIKNWLLMGLPEAEQRDLHDNHWIRIERKLKAEHASELIDIFLRDFIRWKTGRNLGIRRVHEEFRRWAVKSGNEQDRAALCRELARLAGLYGILTGTAGGHTDAGVERSLKHLRTMRIHAHRPFSLRLLDDARGSFGTGTTTAAVAAVLEAVGTWITRMWLADRPTTGLNTAATELAHSPGPEPGNGYVEHWMARLRKFRGTRVGVPGDDHITDGVRSRKAYGGAATTSTHAVLCSLMEAEQGPESPARDKLTVEHVMPRKLTASWKRDLGEQAQDIHERWHDRLPNLTLSGDTINFGMGAATFSAKRPVYANSAIKITQRIAREAAWDEEALRRRAEKLARQVLERWPWNDGRAGQSPGQNAVRFRWRVGRDPWREDTVAAQMVLNIAAALLSLDRRNAERLSGNAVSSNVHPAISYPPGKKAGALTLHAIPGHEEFVLYPYRGDSKATAKFCRKLGKRCGVRVEIEWRTEKPVHAFWKAFRKEAPQVSGSDGAWKSPTQKSDPVNETGDRIRISAGKDMLRLDIAVYHPCDGELSPAERAQKLSHAIHNAMSDENIGDSSDSGTGVFTVGVERAWTREDRSQWPEAIQWIRDQYERLRTIAKQADSAG